MEKVNTIINPKTGRRVKVDGKIGKQIIADMKKNKDKQDAKSPSIKKQKVIKSKTPTKQESNHSNHSRQSKDKLFFYSKSKDAPVGKGANEFVESPTDYEKLGKIKDWRKVLSNFHVSEFEYNGYTYRSIEHVFQAMKIAIADPEKALLFTVESGNAIGLGDGGVAQKNRKLVKLSDSQLLKWEFMKDQVMEDAAIEKYKASSEARKVLKGTKDAELWHVVMRSKPFRFTHLERIRKNL